MIQNTIQYVLLKNKEMIHDSYPDLTTTVILFAQGVASSKNDDFSLSSGDFPSLGSERENSGKKTDSQGDIVFL